MSVRGYGRTTPLQSYMLALAGVVTHLEPEETTDEDRSEAIQSGLSKLRKWTGEDYGIDLGKWHLYLLGDVRYRGDYTSSEAWEPVRKSVEASLTNPAYQRLVEKVAGVDDGS
jgi:hypothetical protein